MIYNRLMAGSVSHSREEETLESKVRWFRSLTLEQRMDYLVMMTELVLENNPHIADVKNAELPKGRVLILERPRS